MANMLGLSAIGARSGGMGQRANAQVLDLNRDHMKLESPDLLADAKTYPILRGK